MYEVVEVEDFVWFCEFDFMFYCVVIEVSGNVYFFCMWDFFELSLCVMYVFGDFMFMGDWYEVVDWYKGLFDMLDVGDEEVVFFLFCVYVVGIFFD